MVFILGSREYPVTIKNVLQYDVGQKFALLSGESFPHQEQKGIGQQQSTEDVDY